MNKKKESLYNEVKTSYVFIGRVLRPHSRWGEVKLLLSGCDAETFSHVASKDFFLLFPDGVTCRRCTLEKVRFHKGGALVQFEGISSISDAETLRNAEVYIPEEQRPSLAEDEYYYDDLLGLEVIDAATGQSIGRVKGIFGPPGSENLNIDLLGRSLLLPCVAELIHTVDLARGTITVTIPTGLIDTIPPTEKGK